MFMICDGCRRPIQHVPYEIATGPGGSILELHDHNCYRTWRYRTAWETKVRTPAQMRRFIDDPASDPDLAGDLAAAVDLFQKLTAACNVTPPEDGSEVQRYDGSDD